MRSKTILAAALALASCAPDRPADNTATSDDIGNVASGVAPSTSGAPVPAEAASTTVSGRVSRYTRLDGCTLVRENPEEAGFRESRCGGVDGVALRLIDADARQNLFVIAPDGDETSLRLSEIGGGGFSTLGSVIEWRGDAGRAPDALIARYRVTEAPGQETDYLIVASLADTPCVVARIDPGAQQNVRARSAADSERACLTR